MSICKMRLHHYPGLRSARVAWLIHELQEPFDIVEVDVFGGEQYSGDFRALNPAHCLPVLEFQTESGESVTMLESSAIITLLADLWPEARLAPSISDTFARFQYLQEICFCAATLDMMLWQIRVHQDLLEYGERDERTIRRYKEKFSAEVEPRLAKRLSDDEYICGKSFTAADCMIGHAVIWARAYGLCMSEPLDAYVRRIMARDAFQRAFADSRNVDLRPTNLDAIRGKFNG